MSPPDSGRPPPADEVTRASVTRNRGAVSTQFGYVLDCLSRGRLRPCRGGYTAIDHVIGAGAALLSVVGRIRAPRGSVALASNQSQSSAPPQAK